MGRSYRVNEGAGAAGKRVAPGDDTPDGLMAAGGAASRGNYRGRLTVGGRTYLNSHTEPLYQV